MALSISKEINDSGANASYFRVSRVTVDRRRNVCSVEVEAWKDVAARNDASKQPMGTITKVLPLADCLSNVDILTIMYTQLKLDADFSGALDI